MKTLIFLLFLIFSTNSNAQLQDILVQNDWYLYSLNIDGTSYSPPVNAEVSSVLLTFQEINTEVLLETFVCNSGFGNITVNEADSSFTFNEGIDITLILCDISENMDFEGYYFGFYYDNVAEVFTCEVVFIDDGSGNEVLELIVNAPNGDFAHYFNYILSSEEFKKSIFSLYPNPIEDIFFVNSNTEIEDNNVSIIIYNVFGIRLLERNNISSYESVNIENFKSGIYFVSIKDENGNTSVKRLIKK